MRAPGADADATTPVLRELGAFERVIDLYASRNPVQFSLAVELAEPVSGGALEEALAHLQQTHPLLATRVDRTGHRPTFRAAASPITLRRTSQPDWRVAAADEQARPIDLDTGPLVRAVHVTAPEGDSGAVVLLTFSHQVTDGRGALLAVRDLVAALDGERPAPHRVPPDQESLLREQPDPPPTEDGPATVEPAGPESATGSIRAFDRTPPHVESAELGAVRTAQLRAAARQHGSTIQGVLCAVAAEALGGAAAEPTVRINAPIDLRSTLDLEDEVVNRFTATTVVLTPGGAGPTATWDLARDATEQLRAARRRARATALALASLAPTDAQEAEAAMLAATASDIEITNLGSAAPASSVVAIWGPTMSTQVRGERILGVVTHAGTLRMTLTSHDHPPGLPADIVGRLEAL